MKACIIAHFGEDFFKSRIDFVRFLEQKGVKCVSFVPKDAYEEQIRNSGKKTFFYPNYSRNWKSIFSFFAVYSYLRKGLKRESPDLLFTFKFFPNLLGCYVAHRLKTKTIVATVAGIGFLEKQDQNKLIRLVAKIYFHNLNKAKVVIAQNREDVAFLRQHLSGPKVVLTHGSGIMTAKSILSEAEKTAFLIGQGLNPEINYITFCSRIVREKGIVELIRAYLKAVEMGINYDLIIAGWYDDSNLEEEVKTLSSGNKRIHWLGYQKDVNKLLAISKAVLLPSYYPEGVPRALTEALALGKIIITTDHKGCRETCLHNKNGFLVTPKSVQSLASALQEFNILSPAKITAFQKESIALFQSKFIAEVVYNTIWTKIF